MAHSLHANALVARELFAEANETLGFDLQHACFEGPEAYLTETRVCQPALYVHGMILFRLLRERGMLGDWQAALIVTQTAAILLVLALLERTGNTQ